MTIKVDSNQFLFDSLDRICKQTHLADNYELGMFSPSEIPTSIRKLGKGIIPADFFNGAKAKIVVLKAKNPVESKDDDQIKVAKFLKTTFFLTDDSAFSANDVYQIKEIDSKTDADNEDTDALLKNVYFFGKIELN